MKIPFSPPYIDDHVTDEVLESLRSGWITTGPKVAALEKELGEYVGTENVVCVNSWTSAAIMMLSWFGVGEGDEVIVPAYTYSATALAVLHCGATPVMVDILEDFTMDPAALERAITSRTKAVIPVDIGGWPADYDGIANVVKSKSSLFEPRTDIQRQLNRPLILSDSAHSFGAKYKGARIGSQQDLVIFSLHAVKNLTTAEGGAICINLPEPFDNSEVKKFLKIYSLNGQTKDAFTKSKAGGWRYDIITQGFKFNMPDVCAAIGLAQLREYDKLLKRRQEVSDLYSSIFANYDWAVCPPATNNERTSSAHLFMLRIKGCDEECRNRIIDRISKEEVSVNVHFVPMPMLTLFKDLGYEIEDYPTTYKQYCNEISLPIYPQLTDEQVRYVAETVANCVSDELSND